MVNAKHTCSSDAAQSRSSFRLRAEIVPEHIPACPGVGAASCCLGKSPRDWDGEEGLSAAGAGVGRGRLRGHLGTGASWCWRRDRGRSCQPGFLQRLKADFTSSAMKHSHDFCFTSVIAYNSMKLQPELISLAADKGSCQVWQCVITQGDQKEGCWQPPDKLAPG